MLFSQFLALASAELSAGMGKQLRVSGATAPGVTPASGGEL